MEEWRNLTLCALCMTLLTYAGAADTLVDLTGPGCDKLDGYYITSLDDVISLYNKPQYNAVATRDQCDITVNAEQGRRIQYAIEVINFNQCGVEIILFDNPTTNINPLRTITCNDNFKTPIYGKTNYNVLRVRVRKTNPQSRVFDFAMRLKNDLGPTLEFEHESAQYAGQSLEPGAIAGIAIAGVILIIALILLAIYCCIRSRTDNLKTNHGNSIHGDAIVYTTGHSQVIFPSGAPRYPKGKYGSMEDVRSSTSSTEKANGAYANAAYTTGPGETKSERSSSFRRARKAGFANEAYDAGDGGGDGSWQEKETSGGSKRLSRIDAYENSKTKPSKSAIKKPTEIEMSKVNTQQPKNGILKTRLHSPDRSQTSSTDASQDPRTMIYGYSHLGKDQPNVHHNPVLERKRSRSGTRSHRSGSSAGRSSSREHKSNSASVKKMKNNRMYSDDVFIATGKSSRSHSGERRTRSGSHRKRSERTERTSDSLDSASSTTSHSRKVSMNPGGKRVHIKGEETDI